MTETVQIAITVAVAPTLLALGTLVVGWRNSRKTDSIHSMVDGNLTAVKKDLAVQIEHTKKLEEILLTMTNTRASVVKEITTPIIPTIPNHDEV